MKASRLEFPTGQNWSCHGCTDCCRHHLFVPLSAAEKERLEQQNWTAADGVDPAKMIVAGVSQHRLGHQADGACIFLDASGRCRIHQKFGEASKPLACRLYPLVIHPAGKRAGSGVRFSCPSAAANSGKPLTGQAAEIARLAPLVLPEGADNLPPPPVISAPIVEWPDFLRFVHWLDVALAAENVPVALKLLRALHWLEKIEQGRFDQISGDAAGEILKTLAGSAAEKLPHLLAQPAAPTRFGRLFLRMMVLEHARVATVADQDVRSAHRWKMLVAASRFILASGLTPALRDELKPVRFADIEQFSGVLSPASEALLTRYFRTKIQSLQFCGVAFYHCSLTEGFRNLALLYPLIIWLARWQAVSAGRPTLSEADVQRAVTLVDYQYGFAPYVSWRPRLLQQRNDIVRLCAWYGR